MKTFMSLFLGITLSSCTPGIFFADSLLDVDGDGFLPDAGDCDDREPAAHPDHAEICDAIDNDCDGDIDGADADIGDADGDGSDGCTDCDDDEPARTPGAPEACDGLDSDCDGEVPPNEVDVDGDGLSECAGDCDEATPTTHAGADEICNGFDDDCDGAIDEGLDPDDDGVTECDGDCAPEDPSIVPGAPEGCDGTDTDCDGDLPDAEADLDADGVAACEGDCDDDDASVHPGAVELCDGIDQGCAGAPDVGEADADADGVRICGGDCDDGAPTVHAGAAELCDGLDTDCDSVLDPDELDADGDGFAPCAGDCDDDDDDHSPATPELCDGIDNDCDELVDAADVADLPDADADGDDPCVDCDDGDPLVGPSSPELCGNGIDDDCDEAIDPTAAALVARRAAFGGGGDPQEMLLLEFDGGGAPLLAGTFGSSESAGTIELVVAVADLSGDGTDDVVFQLEQSAGATDEVLASVTTCDGGEAIVTVAEFPASTLDRVWGAADLDGDGDDDLVAVAVADGPLGTLHTALADGIGGFAQGEPAGALQLPGLVARWTLTRTPIDLNGDAVPDLVECGWTPPSGASACLLVPGLGDGTFGTPLFAALLSEPVDSVATADFDGDGQGDLLVGLAESGEAWLLSGNGAGGFGLPSLAFDLDDRAEVTAADVNGDAFADVVALTYDDVVPSDRVLVTLLGDGAGGFTTGGTFATSSNHPNPAGPDTLAATRP